MAAADGALEAFRARCWFSVGLRFELFYAMQVLTDPAARLHPGWREAARAALPARFEAAFAALGGSPALLSALPDALDPGELGPTFDALRAALVGLPPARLRERVLEGVLHDARVAAALGAGELDVRGAVLSASRPKREWLAFLGLYPFRGEAPVARALDLLARDPEAYQAHLVDAADAFWAGAFRRTWGELTPALRQAAEEKARLFWACDLDEFLRAALLRIGYDARRGALEALRGGYRVPLGRVSACHFLPSAFNDRRHWSAYADGEAVVVHAPFFDPALAVAGAPPPARLAEPAFDPALVCRALGEATRWAIAQLLAEAPRSAAELGRALGLSKANISHHVALLREAGLVDATRGALRLRREVLEDLSAMTVAALFGPRPR